MNGIASGGLALSLRVTPLNRSADEEPRLLVSFFSPEHEPGHQGGDDQSVPPGESENMSEALRLSQEDLASSREELQALNEELRASNDQLNIANNDLASANAQLNAKIGDLETQSHVLSSGQVATLFLDDELRVRWFTRAVDELFPLTPVDTGRCIEDLVPRFDYPSFISDVHRVTSTGEPSEAEIWTASGHCYFMRILPFRTRTAVGASAGVAVTFNDVSDRKRAELAAEQEFRYTRVLQELSARLVTKESARTIYEEVLTAAVLISQSDAGTVQIYDPATQSLVLLANRNIDAHMREYFHRVSADSGTACGVALVTGKRTFVDFDDKTDEACLVHVQAGLRSAQATPLLSRDGTPLGMLNTHWRQSRYRPNERQLRFLDLLARQTADLIERTNAEDALSEELRSTEILRRLSARLVTEESIEPIYEEILTAAIDITRAEAGTVQMLDTDAGQLVVLATRGFSRGTMEYFHRIDAGSNTSCGLALRTGERAYFDFDPASSDVSIRKHVEDGILSAQSSPLFARSGRAIGMISTHWAESGRRPSERELRFLDLLARQAADLIEQQRTAVTLRQSDQYQTFLLKLSDALVSIADSAQIKSVATRLIGEHLGVNRAFYADAKDAHWHVINGYEHDIEPLPTAPFPMAKYGDWIIACFRDGKPLIVDDMVTDVRFDESQRAAHLVLGIRSEVALPLLKNGALSAMIAVHSAAPRVWSERDLKMLREVAERTRAAAGRIHTNTAP